MKKVVSFCLYGNKPLYCLGMIENAQIIKNLMPTWTTRVYHDNVPEGILNVLQDYNCDLVRCVSKGYDWEGMFWRFYPWHDPTVDIWLSRDADSRITERELGFVEEWIQSPSTFHIIRDNPQHFIPILGGTFGVKNKQFKARYPQFKLIDQYLNKLRIHNNKNLQRGPDQGFLCSIVWPMISRDHMAHISDGILSFNEGCEKIIQKCPNFVGNVIEPSPETKEQYGSLCT